MSTENNVGRPPLDRRLVTQTMVDNAVEAADWGWHEEFGVPSPEDVMTPILEAAMRGLTEQAPLTVHGLYRVDRPFGGNVTLRLKAERIVTLSRDDALLFARALLAAVSA